MLRGRSARPAARRCGGGFGARAQASPRGGALAKAAKKLAAGLLLAPSRASAPPPKEEEVEENGLRVRSVFISDVHLGTAGCQAEELLAFLRFVSSDYLFLVGDIIDGWELSSGRVWWPQSHSDVVQKLLKKARKGTKVVYLSGNHDEALRPAIRDNSLAPFAAAAAAAAAGGAGGGGGTDHPSARSEGIELGENLVILNETVHVTADGRRLLVLHGDRCDLTPHIRTDLNYMLKNLLYRAFQAFNRVIKWCRRTLGLPYFSLATAVNANVSLAASMIANYEAALAGEARCQGVDGVVCGHIHHAALRELEGVLYVNTGDWVDSLTAVVEHPDGRLEVVRWLEKRDEMRREAGRRRARAHGGGGQAGG